MFDAFKTFVPYLSLRTEGSSLIENVGQTNEEKMDGSKNRGEDYSFWNGFSLSLS